MTKKKNFRINTQRFNASISEVVYKKFKEKLIRRWVMP
jgi:hypothetical protein